MTAPLRDVLVKRPGPAFGAAFADPAHGFLHPVDLALAQAEHDRFVEVLGSLGPRVHELGRRDGRPGPRLHLRPAARGRRRRNSAPAGQAEPSWRTGGPRDLDPRRGHPDRRPDRGAGHDRGRRHVLAPARPAVHRPHPPDQRGGRPPAGGDRRRGRPGLRRALLARRPGAHPPAVPHLAGRRRPRGRLHAAPAGRAVGAARAISGSAPSRFRRRSSAPWAATSSRSGRGS